MNLALSRLSGQCGAEAVRDKREDETANKTRSSTAFHTTDWTLGIILSETKSF